MTTNNVQFAPECEPLLPAFPQIDTALLKPCHSTRNAQSGNRPAPSPITQGRLVLAKLARDADQEEEQRSTGTVASSAINLFVSMCGAGAFSSSYALLCSGFVLAFIIMAGSLALSVGGVLVMWDARRRASHGLYVPLEELQTYQDLARVAWGRPGYVCVAILQGLITFMASIAYLVLIKDQVRALSLAWFDHALTRGDVWLVLFVVIAAVYPVSLFQRINSLRYTSFMSAILILLITSGVIYRYFVPYVDDGGASSPPSSTSSASSSNHPTVRAAVFKLSILESISLFAVSYMCHYNVVPILVELKNKSQARVNGTISLAFGLSTIVYILIGVFGYLCFGDATHSDLLTNYSSRDRILNVARAGLTVALVLTAPLVIHPTKTMVVNLLWGPLDERLRPAIVSFILCVTAYVLAVLIKDILTVWGFYGATVGPLYMYVGPPLVSLRLRHTIDFGIVWTRSAVAELCLLVLGIVLLLVCTGEASYKISTGSPSSTHTGAASNVTL